MPGNGQIIIIVRKIATDCLGLEPQQMYVLRADGSPGQSLCSLGVYVESPGLIRTRTDGCGAR